MRPGALSKGRKDTQRLTGTGHPLAQCRGGSWQSSIPDASGTWPARPQHMPLSHTPARPPVPAWHSLLRVLAIGDCLPHPGEADVPGTKSSSGSAQRMTEARWRIKRWQITASAPSPLGGLTQRRVVPWLSELPAGTHPHGVDVIGHVSSPPCLTSSVLTCVFWNPLSHKRFALEPSSPGLLWGEPTEDTP